MDAAIEKLIGVGQATVTAKEVQAQEISQKAFDAELGKRLDAWAQVCDNVRDQLPEALWDYLEPRKEGGWMFEDRELEYGYPLKALEFVYLEVPGLQQIAIGVSMRDEKWQIQDYRIRRGDDSNARESKSILCDSLAEALYHAKVQAERARELEEIYEERARKFEAQELLKEDEEELAVDFDPEKMLRQAMERCQYTDENHDPIARALVAIGLELCSMNKRQRSYIELHGTSVPVTIYVEESADIYERLAKVLTPAQVELIERSLYDVRKAGGYGKVYVELQAGSVKFIGTDIRRPA